jgi:preprotein translocase subunit SecD
MKSMQCSIFLSLALSVCFGCSRSTSSTGSTPVLQPPDHGTAFLLQYDAAAIRNGTNSLADLKKGVTKRLLNIGIQIYWESTSNSQVRILTSITQQAQIAMLKKSLAHRGMLECHLVNEASDELIQQGRLAPGYELMKETNMTAGSSRVTAYLVKREPELTGRYVQKAWTATNAMGGLEIDFQFDPAGAKLFQKITAENVGKQLAMAVDGQIFSAPRIAGPVPDGRGVITGNFTQKDTETLVNVLDCPLPFPVRVTDERTY